jgi:hypothetical protein
LKTNCSITHNKAVDTVLTGLFDSNKNTLWLQNKIIENIVTHTPVIKQEQLEEFYNTLGHQFIAGGDYNSKHNEWDPE